MSGAPKYIVGELVQLGTPEGSDQPRALIHCRESDVAAVKYAPLLRRVAIVPLDQSEGSDVPPIVLENRRLRDVMKASAVTLTRYAAECFPQVPGETQVHFVRALMESVATELSEAMKDQETKGGAA